MKNIIFRILTSLLLCIMIVSVSCSKHCDDEDYTRDSNSQQLVITDSLKVSSTQLNEM